MFAAGQYPGPLPQIAASYHPYQGQSMASQQVLPKVSSRDGISSSGPRFSPRTRQDAVVTRKRSIPRLDGSIVTVNIHYGEDESKTVFVHKSYLCRYSKYFRAALNNPAFVETESQEIDLEEMGTEAFDSFLHWVYHRSIPPLETVNLHQLQDLLRLWIFADKYIVPNLQNHVMNHMIRLLDDIMMGADHSMNFGAAASRHPTSALFEYAYKNTTDGSLLRRVLADWLAVSFRGIDADNLPLEMVRDIFKSVQQLPDEGGFIRRDDGYYFVNGILMHETP